MGIEQLILEKLQKLSEEQRYSVLGYMEYLLALSTQPSPCPFPPTRVEEGVGCVGYPGSRKSLEEMQQGIEAEAKRQWQQEDRA